MSQSTHKLLDPATIRKGRVHSQAGQDGVIQSIFNAIGTTNKCCVEFGFNSDALTGGSGSNTARLILEDQWKGLLFDGEFSNPAINLHREFISPDNIGEIFARYKVPAEPDYVSIDVDSVDLWLFLALLKANYRPRLISVEYNCQFRLHESVTVKPGTSWSHGDAVYGASLAAFYHAGRDFNYRLVAAEAPLDLFFVRGDLIDPQRVPALASFSMCTGILMHKTPSPDREKLMVQYPSLEPVTLFPWNDVVKSSTFVANGPVNWGAWAAQPKKTAP